MADINFGEPAEVKVPVVDTENKDTLNSNPLSDVNTNASEIDDKGMSVNNRIMFDLFVIAAFVKYTLYVITNDHIFRLRNFGFCN